MSLAVSLAVSLSLSTLVAVHVFCFALCVVIKMSANVTGTISLGQLVSALELKVLPLFYLVPPSHSMYPTVGEVPDYLKEVSVC